MSARWSAPSWWTDPNCCWHWVRAEEQALALLDGGEGTSLLYEICIVKDSSETIQMLPVKLNNVICILESVQLILSVSYCRWGSSIIRYVNPDHRTVSERVSLSIVTQGQHLSRLRSKASPDPRLRTSISPSKLSQWGWRCLPSPRYGEPWRQQTQSWHGRTHLRACGRSYITATMVLVSVNIISFGCCPRCKILYCFWRNTYQQQQYCYSAVVKLGPQRMHRIKHINLS